MSVYVSKDLLDKSNLPDKYIYSLLFTTHYTLKDNFCDHSINIYCRFSNVFQVFTLPLFSSVVHNSLALTTKVKFTRKDYFAYTYIKERHFSHKANLLDNSFF